MRLKLLSLLITLFCAGPAVATEVFVGNIPYDGTVYGTAAEFRFVLSELADALGVEVKEKSGQWLIDGRPVATIRSEGKVWVEMSAIPKELVRIVRNKELNTIDLYLVETVEAPPEEDWANGGTMILFYADWSEACIAMEQTIAYIAESPSLKVEFLNIDYPNSSVYRNRVRLFQGNEIPYFVILDANGRRLDSFSGFFTYGELLDRLQEAFAKAK